MAKLVSNGRLQYVDGNGDPYSGAQLFTYQAGSSTKEPTYADSDSATPNTNPIILDSSGFTPNQVWLTEGQSYKFVLAPSGDTDPPASPIITDDNITGINDNNASVTFSQWVGSGLTPTFISTTSFSLEGDQRTEFHVGRRLKTTNSGGTIYSSISAVAYTSLTTVTVTNDSGVLDSGLSAVSYGILTKTNDSIPVGVISTDKVADDAITLPKMASGTAGHLISYDGSGDPQTETYQKWIKHSEIDLTNSGANDTAAFTFSSIPASATMLRLVVHDASLGGSTDEIGVQLGDSGGVETSGYSGVIFRPTGSPANTSFSADFLATTDSAAADVYDLIQMDFTETASNLWTCNIQSAMDSNSRVFLGGGHKTLSAELTQLKVHSASETDNFDGGTAILYYYGNDQV